MIESILLYGVVGVVSGIIGAVVGFVVAKRGLVKDADVYERERVRLITSIRHEAKTKGRNVKIDPLATVQQLHEKYEAVRGLLPVAPKSVAGKPEEAIKTSITHHQVPPGLPGSVQG